MACDAAVAPNGNNKVAFSVKWIASVIQILGYGATAFGMTPWNIYLFVVGIIGWFAVGVMWKDRAIILLHVIALGAIVLGTVSA